MRKVVYIVLRDGKHLCWMHGIGKAQGTSQATTSRKRAIATAKELNEQHGPTIRYSWHPCMVFARAQ